MKRLFSILCLLLPFVVLSQDTIGKLADVLRNEPEVHPLLEGVDVSSPPIRESSREIDVPISETHIRQEDGTYKPKYKTYNPNVDNDAVPGNRIEYRKNDDALLYSFSVVALLAVGYFVYNEFSKRK